MVTIRQIKSRRKDQVSLSFVSLMTLFFVLWRSPSNPFSTLPINQQTQSLFSLSHAYSYFKQTPQPSLSSSPSPTLWTLFDLTLMKIIHLYRPLSYHTQNKKTHTLHYSFCDHSRSIGEWGNLIWWQTRTEWRRVIRASWGKGCGHLMKMRSW